MKRVEKTHDKPKDVSVDNKLEDYEEVIELGSPEMSSGSNQQVSNDPEPEEAIAPTAQAKVQQLETNGQATNPVENGSERIESKENATVEKANKPGKPDVKHIPGHPGVRNRPRSGVSPDAAHSHSKRAKVSVQSTANASAVVELDDLDKEIEELDSILGN